MRKFCARRNLVTNTNIHPLPGLSYPILNTTFREIFLDDHFPLVLVLYSNFSFLHGLYFTTRAEFSLRGDDHSAHRNILWPIDNYFLPNQLRLQQGSHVVLFNLLSAFLARHCTLGLKQTCSWLFLLPY